MAFVPPKDRVLERSNSNSQSVFALSGAPDASYNAFSASMSVGDTTIGAIVEPGAAFKTGILTYSAANEITVTTAFESKGVFSSSGTKEVFMGLPAASAFPAVRSITSAATIGRADHKKIVIANGGSTDFTISLAAIAALGSGFTCRLKSIGTGVVTLDPDGSEAIDGAATIPLFPQQEIDIACDGSALHTFGRSKPVVLQRLSVAAAGSINIALAKGWQRQRILFEDLRQSASGNLQILGSNDGGTTYLTGSFYFSTIEYPGASALNESSLAGQPVASLTNNTLANVDMKGELTLYGAPNAAPLMFRSTINGYHTALNLAGEHRASGFINSPAGAWTHLAIFPASGTFTGKFIHEGFAA